MVLGLAAASAPWFFHPEPGLMAITLNAVVVGIAISILATLDLVVPPHWEEPFEVLCGSWLMVSPSWLGYGGPLMLTHLAVGALVIFLAALEFWHDRAAMEA